MGMEVVAQRGTALCRDGTHGTGMRLLPVGVYLYRAVEGKIARGGVWGALAQPYMQSQI